MVNRTFLRVHRFILSMPIKRRWASKPRRTQCLSLLPAPVPAITHGPYATTFSRAENPISEGGQWLNGQTDGIDWTDIRTTPGFAFGTEIGEQTRATKIRRLHGPFEVIPDPWITKVWEEVELRLRRTDR